VHGTSIRRFVLRCRARTPTEASRSPFAVLVSRAAMANRRPACVTNTAATIDVDQLRGWLSRRGGADRVTTNYRARAGVRSWRFKAANFRRALAHRPTAAASSRACARKANDAATLAYGSGGCTNHPTDRTAREGWPHLQAGGELHMSKCSTSRSGSSPRSVGVRRHRRAGVQPAADVAERTSDPTARAVE